MRHLSLSLACVAVWTLVCLAPEDGVAQGIEAIPPGSDRPRPPGGDSRPTRPGPLRYDRPDRIDSRTRSTTDIPTWLGLQVGPVDTEVDDDGDETSSGVRITRIVDDSPASRADLEVGDRMLAVDGEAVESLSELQTIVGRHAPGDEVEVRLERDGGQSTVSIVVGAKPGRHELVRSQLIGTELPDVEVETSSKEGESEGVRTRSIDAWSGRPVVVEFWATWCAPCRQLEPVLRTLEKQYGDRLHVLGVSSEGWTTLRSYRSEHGPLPYDVLRDGDRSLHDRWFVSSYPTLVVVDASGEVENVLFGLDGARRLESIVGSMLEGSESTEDRDAADDGERDDGADE